MVRILSTLALGSLFVVAVPASGLAQSTTFRRPEVVKLMKVKDPYYLTTTKVKESAKEIVLAADHYQKTKSGNHGYHSFRWVRVPLDKTKPVSVLSNKEARKLGLRPLVDAMRDAATLEPGSKFSAGQPFKKVTYSYITTGHNKHAGSGRSFVFSAKMSKPVDGHDQVSLSVPFLKSTRGAQAAWR